MRCSTPTLVVTCCAVRDGFAIADETIAHLLARDQDASWLISCFRIETIDRCHALAAGAVPARESRQAGFGRRFLDSTRGVRRSSTRGVRLVSASSSRSGTTT